jgi:signal transduction histidine kinase
VQDALRARDELLTIAAHEIRGPLNAIHLAVRSIRQGQVPPEALSSVFELLERQGRRLAHFVDELLDLGRIRAGRMRLEYEDVSLTEVVREVVSRLNRELVRSGSQLALTARSDVVGRWDRSRLDQIVSNLVTNAIKFGMGKAIEITVDEHGADAMLVVKDHGMGIAREVQERLFKPFERGVSVRHYGGLGLGLYIVSAIVDALRGSVRVRSEPGEGAEFTVGLPRSPAPE